jgi:hypothetical protein
VVLPETNIIVDNAINPDLDDYIVATTLQIGEADVMVRMIGVISCKVSMSYQKPSQALTVRRILKAKI